MARTVWGEARGEDHIGQVAVANVILNRARNKKRWSTKIADVCKQPWQFSAWNANDPNRPKMLTAEATDRAMRGAIRACLDAFDKDVTHGADHYFADYIDKPGWAEGMRRTCKIGVHEFYKS